MILDIEQAKKLMEYALMIVSPRGKAHFNVIDFNYTFGGQDLRLRVFTPDTYREVWAHGRLGVIGLYKNQLRDVEHYIKSKKDRSRCGEEGLRKAWQSNWMLVTSHDSTWRTGLDLLGIAGITSYKPDLRMVRVGRIRKGNYLCPPRMGPLNYAIDVAQMHPVTLLFGTLPILAWRDGLIAYLSFSDDAAEYRFRKEGSEWVFESDTFEVRGSLEEVLPKIPQKPFRYMRVNKLF